MAFTVDQIHASHRADRNVVGLGRLKARLKEERLELVANMFIAVLRPIDLTKKGEFGASPSGENEKRNKPGLAC